MQQLAVGDLAALCAASETGAGDTFEARRPLLLDVREAWEFELAAIHIDGLLTLNLPMGELPSRLAELDPLQPVVCICHHGMRSAQVVAFLERQGFNSVYNLAGGIDAWSSQVDPSVPRY